jgi:hypothetical protein
MPLPYLGIFEGTQGAINATVLRKKMLKESNKEEDVRNTLR